MRTLNVLVLVACGGNPKPPPETVPATASMIDCGEVASHVVKVLAAARPRPGATLEAVQSMVTSRCRADAWSDATKECLHASATIAAGRACASTMNDEQRTAITAQARALRTDTSEPSAPADSSSDWVEHVVEEPATPTR